MTIELDLSVVEDLPRWAWITAGVVAWYVFAAVVIRYTGEPRSEQPTVEEEFCDAFRLIGWWIVSPLVIPVFFVLLSLVGFGHYVLQRRKS